MNHTNLVRSNDDQGNVYQFENSKFHEPQVRVVALGCGHTGDIVNMLNFIISYAILLGIGQTN